jgi:RimJ/RimL family protein N-acetyltransferase
MPGDATLRTQRLLLRPWTAGDRAAFAELNADPHVMEWFAVPSRSVPDHSLGILHRRLIRLTTDSREDATGHRTGQGQAHRCSCEYAASLKSPPGVEIMMVLCTR